MRSKDDLQRLGVDLRFRPNGNAAHWQRILESVTGWEPRLRPVGWVEASDPDQTRHPWSDGAAADLCARCAAHTAMARILEADSGPIGGMTVRVRKSEIVMMLALPRPVEPLDRYYGKLLQALQPDRLPAIGMMFDLDASHDAEVIFQGLRGLNQVPPYLSLDGAAVDKAGRDRLKSAPCTVEETPGDGLLLVTRPDPWARRIGDELRRARAVDQHLGVSPQTPLVLV